MTDTEIQEVNEENKPIKSVLRKSKKIDQDMENRTNDSIPARRNWMMITLIVLLGLLVVISGFNTVMSQIRYQQEIDHRNQVIRSVATYTANLDALTTQMLDEYKKNVYSNPAVDTTAKQQVLGTEYNFNAIMLLIKQNSRLMEVLAQMK